MQKDNSELELTHSPTGKGGKRVPPPGQKEMKFEFEPKELEINTAFFGLAQNIYLETKLELGENIALDVLTWGLARGLKEAYQASGFKEEARGNPEEFKRLLTARDNAVGLRVLFPEVTENRIVYQFLDDPFPDLKGHVDPEKLATTYMDFKVSYLLGKEWSYHMTKHFWKGDNCIEYVIEKK